MLNVKIYNNITDEVVYSFQAAAQNIPIADDTVWVPQDNAPDVAYYVKGRQFDYEEGEVRLACEKNAELEKVT